LCNIQELQTKVKDKRDHHQCTKNHSAQTQEQVKPLLKDDKNIKAATYEVSSRLTSSTDLNIFVRMSKQSL